MGGRLLGPGSPKNGSEDGDLLRESGRVGNAIDGSTGRPLDGSKSVSARRDCNCVGDALTELHGLSTNIDGKLGRADAVDQGFVEEPSVYEGLVVRVDDSPSDTQVAPNSSLLLSSPPPSTCELDALAEIDKTFKSFVTPP